MARSGGAMRLRVGRQLQLPALRHPRARHQRPRQASPRSSYLFTVSVMLFESVYDPCGSADLNPNFHFDGDPDPDPDWHQNDSDPHVDPTQSFTHCFLLIAILYHLHILISFSLPHSPFCVFRRFPLFFLLVAWLTILVLFFRSLIVLSNDIHDGWIPWFLIPFPFLISVLFTFFLILFFLFAWLSGQCQFFWSCTCLSTENWDGSSFMCNRLIFTLSCGETCNHVRTLCSLSSSRLCAVLLQVLPVHCWVSYPRIVWFMISVQKGTQWNWHRSSQASLNWMLLRMLNDCCWGCWMIAVGDVEWLLLGMLNDCCWGCWMIAVGDVGRRQSMEGWTGCLPVTSTLFCQAGSLWSIAVSAHGLNCCKESCISLVLYMFWPASKNMNYAPLGYWISRVPSKCYLTDRLFMNCLFRAGLEQLYEGMLLAALSQKDPGEIRVRNTDDLVCYTMSRIFVRGPVLFYPWVQIRDPG